MKTAIGENEAAEAAEASSPDPARWLVSTSQRLSRYNR